MVERIRESAATSLEDLLQREAGLQLSRSGGPGANAGLFIRGAGSGNTLVLIDGVRIGAATAGLPELEALSLASIERIEVLRGPGSSLYGADAVGGVVQIFTRRGSGAAAAVGPCRGGRPGRA
jgi:vitamin B12 transporter